MKLLFLANRVPYPPFRGDKLKIWNLAEQLSRRHELHLITFAQGAEEMRYKEPLKEYFSRVELVQLPKWKSVRNALAAAPLSLKPLQVLYFQSGGMRRALQQLLTEETYDAVHVQHLRMAPYLEYNTSLPRILDLPDAFSLYWQRRQELPGNKGKKLFEGIERRRLLRYEAVIKQYTLSLACSAEDVGYLQRTHYASNVRLLPNGVNLDTFHSARTFYSGPKTLLFTGNMDYAPNVDAVQHFVSDIFPKILHHHPDARFVIAGQRPVPAVTALASDKIEVTGFVQDIAPLYDTASIVVAPLRFGAGTQNKVLEAMAMGVPVVSTHIGFEGLSIASGEGVFREMDDVAFAARVNELLSSESFRESTGRKGASIARSRFGWASVANQLERYFEEAIVLHRAEKSEILSRGGDSRSHPPSKGE